MDDRVSKLQVPPRHTKGMSESLGHVEVTLFEPTSSPMQFPTLATNYTIPGYADEACDVLTMQLFCKGSPSPEYSPTLQEEFRAPILPATCSESSGHGHSVPQLTTMGNGSETFDSTSPLMCPLAPRFGTLPRQLAENEHKCACSVHELSECSIDQYSDGTLSEGHSPEREFLLPAQSPSLETARLLNLHAPRDVAPGEIILAQNPGTQEYQISQLPSVNVFLAAVAGPVAPVNIIPPLPTRIRTDLRHILPAMEAQNERIPLGDIEN